MIAEVVATQWVAAVCLAKKSGPGPIWSLARPGSKAFALTALKHCELETKGPRFRASPASCH